VLLPGRQQRIPQVPSALCSALQRLAHCVASKVHVEAQTVQVAFFVNSGSEANDLAMKMARLYGGNYDFLALRNGYHGKRGLNAHSTWRYNMPQVQAAGSSLAD